MNFSQMALSELLKSGSKHLSGLEQAVLRNIEASKEISEKTRTSMGPNGMNKMVINYLNKLFVTHDAATILKELEVIHPAAKILVMASQSQEQEVGDGTNFVISLAGELLNQAGTLLTMMRLHPSDIIAGYKMATTKALEVLEKQAIDTVKDIRDPKEVGKALKAVIGAKQYGYEDYLIPLIAKASVSVCPKNPRNFNVDNVRTVKIPGSSVTDSKLVNGFVLKRDVAGTVKHVEKARIAVFGCSVDIASLDTKEVVELKSGEELFNYSRTEEKLIEDDIKKLAEAGVNVVVSNGGFGEMALHFIERHKMMAIKLTSKFDMRRLCKAVGATPLVRIGAPTEDEMGLCDYVDVVEIGDTKTIVFKQEKEKSQISTIILRGATDNILDELERAVDDGVNVFKALTKDTRLVAGAGAIEMEICKGVTEFAEQKSGLEQYAIRKFAEAFQIIPRTLAENSGLNFTDVLSNLTSAHAEGKNTWGVDIFSPEGLDAVEAGILDLYAIKYWGIRLAAQAAINILSVDTIIMARPAGGPKPPKQSGAMDANDEAFD
jgi:T-complex protein 1 subunit theta